MSGLELDWDISLVLMTHIGFVAMVEQAPPLSEAYTFARNQLSVVISSIIDCKFEISLVTCLCPEVCLCLIIHREIDSPGRNVA